MLNWKGHKWRDGVGLYVEAARLRIHAAAARTAASFQGSVGSHPHTCQVAYARNFLFAVYKKGRSGLTPAAPGSLVKYLMRS